MNQCHCKNHVCYPIGTGKMKHTPCGDLIGYEKGTVELCQAIRTNLALKLYKMKQEQSKASEPLPVTNEEQKGSGELPEGMTLRDYDRMTIDEILKKRFQ